MCSFQTANLGQRYKKCGQNIHPEIATEIGHLHWLNFSYRSRDWLIVMNILLNALFVKSF